MSQHLITSSLSRRTIYPGFQNDCLHQETVEEWSQDWEAKTEHALSFSNEEEQKYFFAESLQEVREHYFNQDYKQVVVVAQKVIRRYQDQAKTDQLKKNALALTYDLSRIRNILGATYIRLYRQERRRELLIKAISECFKFQYNQIETNYKQGVRLNNWGLCELLLGRYTNAVKCFSKAHPLYQSEPTLHLGGLLINLAEVYKQLQMYQQAGKIYEAICIQHDQGVSLPIFRYGYLLVSLLECVNECGTRANRSFQRAEQALPSLESQLNGQPLLPVKLRLQLLRYAVEWGIKEHLIQEQGCIDLLEGVLDVKSSDLRIRFIKGESCLVSRQLFEHNDWQRYEDLTVMAFQFFKAASFVVDSHGESEG